MTDTHRELENLDAASADVVQGLSAAGLTGQMHLHAHLEDLKQTLMLVQSSVHSLSASERLVAREVVLRCHGQLRRTDQILSFIGNLLERQLESGNGGNDYTVAGYGAGSRAVQLLRNRGSLEAEG